jgi:hypothetical protein
MEGNNFNVIYVRNLKILYCTLMSDFLPDKTFVIEDGKKSGKVG